MTLEALLLVAAGLVGIGVYGALSQQSFVMIMMGLETMINGALLAAGSLWAFAAGGSPKGQVLIIVVLTVMAIEMGAGFALVTNIYRNSQVDMTEGAGQLKR